jgi:uncharacterized protein
VLRGPALLAPPDGGPLYRTHPADRGGPYDPTELVAVPYFAWANRDPGRMEVWILRS